MKSTIIVGQHGNLGPVYLKPYGNTWRYVCPVCYKPHDHNDRTDNLLRLCDRCK